MIASFERESRSLDAFLRLMSRHPVQAAALVVTVAATLPIDETGAGEAVDAGEAAAFTADDATSASTMSTMDRVGSGLKGDLFHRATSWVVDDPAATASELINADGSSVTSYSLAGEVNGIPGDFNWILDSNGDSPVITHQFFQPNG
jgi:hypothetical protein